MSPKPTTGAAPSGDPRSEQDLDDVGQRESATPDNDAMSLKEVAAAENSRPTLPDETADGLDDMDEEVRHQAEDRPLDTDGRL